MGRLQFRANIYSRKRSAMSYSLGEKSLFERQQNALREASHLVEDCRNRLVLGRSDLIERYIDGRLDIGLKFTAGSEGEEFVVVFSNNWIGAFGQHFVPFSFGSKTCTTAVANNPKIRIPNLDVKIPYITDYGERNQVDMFVFPVQIVDGPEKFVTSFIRFKRADDVNGVGGEQFSFPLYLLLENLSCLSEREIGSLLGVGVFDRECAGEMIEGCSDVVKDFTDRYSQLFRGRVNPYYPSFLRGVSIHLGGNYISFSSVSRGNGQIKFSDLGFGPFNLRPCSGEGD